MSGGALIAQENNINKSFVKRGDLVSGTFYHEDGRIAQKGYFKDGKLHGEWVAYDQDGNKNAIGKYDEGEKIGKWFFWNEGVLSEVDYQKNRIASVVQWKQEADLVSK